MNSLTQYSSESTVTAFLHPTKGHLRLVMDSRPVDMENPAFIGEADGLVHLISPICVVQFNC